MVTLVLVHTSKVVTTIFSHRISAKRRGHQTDPFRPPNRDFDSRKAQTALNVFDRRWVEHLDRWIHKDLPPAALAIVWMTCHKKSPWDTNLRRGEPNPLDLMHQVKHASSYRFDLIIYFVNRLGAATEHLSGIGQYF